ncbi:MAG: hypothetical protein KJ808_04660 [Acidobacteria bacterium]|nr:hypothetical protein [Acidobacteriota bacterium]MBU4307651.1 hypothetical protein [Acidobacteriota bacterium]MCG2810455.1 hypothetical protein [Candidatus Aminicenantes bacterium]
MNKKAFSILFLLGLSLILTACGGKPGEAGNSQNQAAPAVSTAAAQFTGTSLAKDILSCFDQCVAEAAGLSFGKPEAAELTPKLQALYKRYEEKMIELNRKYLALKAENISEFGAANIYLGENRGKHVFNKDNTLSAAVAFYNFQKGDQAMVNLLSNEIVKLLDVAVKM